MRPVPVAQDDGYYTKPESSTQKPMFMFTGHPALELTPDSRKYPISLLRATAYKGTNVADLSKPGLIPKALAAQSKRLETARDWARHSLPFNLYS
jgi:hypothetical protein